MKKVPLHISIPSPCKEDFAAMAPAGKGRHCGKCSNIIYDFSQMTDSELFRFFQQHPTTHCGRFHNTQLNRDIVPLSIKSSVFKKMAKTAAAVLALITLKSMPVKAAKPTAGFTQQSLPKQQQPFNDSVIIKGVVKDEKGELLKDVIVTDDNGKMAVTDNKGAYQIVLSGSKETQVLYFKYGNYAPLVRTYNPAMGTAFDMIIYIQDYIYTPYNMGVIRAPIIDNTSFVFKNNSSSFLDADIKPILATVAAKLKAIPTSSINIVTHAKTRVAQKVADKRGTAIKKYLVDMEGISADRISINNDDTRANNIIEIRDANQD